MQVTYRWSRWVVMGAALALPFKAGGCGHTACITVTRAQLQQNGACPDPTTAQARFSVPGCAGPTVDGPGTLDNGLCCYPVTPADSTFPCAGEGSGSFGAETSTTGGVGASTGLGGSTCKAALMGTPFTQLTGAAKDALTTLETCACAGSCETICGPTLCTGNAPDNGCRSCLLSTCPTQLMECEQN